MKHDPMNDSLIFIGGMITGVLLVVLIMFLS